MAIGCEEVRSLRLSCGLRVSGHVGHRCRSWRRIERDSQCLWTPGTIAAYHEGGHFPDGAVL